MIRPATHTDLEQIERLIQPYIADFAISREGEEKFSSAAILKLLNTEQIQQKVSQIQQFYLCCYWQALMCLEITTHLQTLYLCS